MLPKNNNTPTKTKPITIVDENQREVCVADPFGLNHLPLSRPANDPCMLVCTSDVHSAALAPQVSTKRREDPLLQ